MKTIWRKFMNIVRNVWNLLWLTNQIKCSFMFTLRNFTIYSGKLIECDCEHYSKVNQCQSINVWRRTPSNKRPRHAKLPLTVVKPGTDWNWERTRNPSYRRRARSSARPQGQLPSSARPLARRHRPERPTRPARPPRRIRTFDDTPWDDIFQNSQILTRVKLRLQYNLEFQRYYQKNLSCIAEHLKKYASVRTSVTDVLISKCNFTNS